MSMECSTIRERLAYELGQQHMRARAFNEGGGYEPFTPKGDVIGEFQSRIKHLSLRRLYEPDLERACSELRAELALPQGPKQGPLDLKVPDHEPVEVRLLPEGCAFVWEGRMMRHLGYAPIYNQVVAVREPASPGAEHQRITGETKVVQLFYAHDGSPA